MFNAKQVMSVYSGRAHACCCGCKGKHTYNSQFRVEASNNRGYEVRRDECNDRVVATMVAKVNRQNEAYPVDVSKNYAAVDVAGRTYVVYFAP